MALWHPATSVYALILPRIVRVFGTDPARWLFAATLAVTDMVLYGVPGARAAVHPARMTFCAWPLWPLALPPCTSHPAPHPGPAAASRMTPLPAPPRGVNGAALAPTPGVRVRLNPGSAAGATLSAYLPPWLPVSGKNLGVPGCGYVAKCVVSGTEIDMGNRRHYWHFVRGPNKPHAFYDPI